MTKSLNIVFLGLTLSSSWGNGHATTFRALIRGLKAGGHRVLFLERDVPWYATERDLPNPDFCDLAYYTDVDGVIGSHADLLRTADAVIVGSYVPDGVAVFASTTSILLSRLRSWIGVMRNIFRGGRFRSSTPISPSPVAKSFYAWNIDTEHERL